MSSSTPLVIDLDGTLIKTDLLVEAMLVFLKEHPFKFFHLFLWLLRGKAYLKEKLANISSIDAETLPYNPSVIKLIEDAKNVGRPIVLATASHQNYAKQVADHLGLFDEMFATQGQINLSSHRKCDTLVAKYGQKGFDYAGNSHDDIPVWQSARHAYVVTPDRGVERKAQRGMNVASVIDKKQGNFKIWLKQLRIYQWAKNFLVFVPLLSSHQFSNPDKIADSFIAFILFGLCASSVYLLNDLLDLKDDRHHDTKKTRPFAAGDLSLMSGLIITPLLLGSSFLGALLFLPIKFFYALLLYYSLTLSYSMFLKRLMTVDVITLASLYTMRTIAGTFAIGVSLTFWMLGFSMFIFLSLAYIKRYTELLQALEKGLTEKTRGRGYYPGDLSIIASLGAASGYISVLVLALYIQDQSVSSLYSQQKFMWLSCPLLLLWISRVWLLTHRGEMHDDPIVFAIKDRVSIIVGALFLGVFWLAS